MKIEVRVMAELLENLYKCNVHEYTMVRHLYINIGYKISIINGKHVVEKNPSASILNPYFWREDRYKENLIGYCEYLRLNDRKSYNIVVKTMKEFGYNLKYSESNRRISIED